MHIFKTPSELEFETINPVAVKESDVDVEDAHKLDESLNSISIDSDIPSGSNDLPQLNLLHPDNGNKLESNLFVL